MTAAAAAPSGLETRRRLGAAAAATAAATAAYVTVSSLAGRLASDMRYDDVSYANEALIYLDAAVQRGLIGLGGALLHDPPHSPFQALLALLGFALFGLRDVSLYLVNGLVLFAAAAWMVRVTREAPRSTAAIAVGAVLVSPLAYLVVANFRPDMALGIVTAVMAWQFLEGLRTGRRAAFVCAGLAFGAALLVKPTFFAHTIALATVLVAMAVAAATLGPRRGWPCAWRNRDVLAFALLGLAIALPYFAVNGPHIVAYFVVNTQGALREQWDFSAAIGWRERLDLNRQLIAANGGAFTVFALVAALASAWGLRRPRPAVALEVVALVALALLSATIIVAGKHPNEMFFASFHWLLVAAASRGFAELGALASATARRRLAALALAGLAIAVAEDTHVGYFGPVAEDTRIGRSATVDVIAAIDRDVRAAAPADTERPASVLVMFSGPLNSNTLLWVARQRGYRLDARGNAAFPSEQAALAEAAAAEYILFANPFSAEYTRNLADARLQAPVLRRLLADPAYRNLGPVDRAGRYFLVANDRALQSRPRSRVIHVDGIPQDLDGLREEEGPYPGNALPLPRLRWMEGREARVCVAGLGPGSRLVATVYASRPARLAVRVDEGAATSRDVPGSTFATLEWPLELRPSGSCVHLASAAADGTAARDLLLFTRLDVLKAAAR